MAVNVEYLKNIIFTKLPLHEKIEIKNKGRPTPDIIIRLTAVSNNRKYIRSFNSDWYDKIKWLCGCEIRNALFCFPCLLFSSDALWTEKGFRNIGRMKEKCGKHQDSRKHMESMVSLSLLGKTNVSGQLSEAYTMAKLKHNEQVKKNREILSKIIDCIKFCAEFESPLLYEHDDNDAAEHPGVFKGLMNFIGTFDPSLQQHLDSSSMFKGTPRTIQNELLHNMLEVCREQIASEIGKTSYVAVMIDDTTDVSENTQLVVVFRYELHGVIYERFWGFFDPQDASTEGISQCILDEVIKVLKNKSDKLIAQTYDGVNVIKGEIGGVQHEIQQVFQNAHFIHCYAHQINQIMKHVSASIQPARLFFANLLGIATFFSKSPQRLTTLDKYVNARIIPKSSDTRWNLNVRTVNTVYENKDNLIKCFEELQSLNAATTDDTIQASTAFCELLKNDPFTFWLELFHKVMPNVQLLYIQLQSRDIDAYKIQGALNKFYKAISEIYEFIYCESGSVSKTKESKEICDRICDETKQRFTNTHHLIAAKLFYKENFTNYRKELPIIEIKETCNTYADLVEEKLMTELQIFYSRKEFHNCNGLVALLHLLSEENLSTVFDETIKLIKILITIPMTTSEPERCFSTLKTIKSFLRNNIDLARLNAQSMISIEKNMIAQTKDFNEKVIEKFCQTKNRRMDFIFK